MSDFALDVRYLVVEKLQFNLCENRGTSLVADLSTRILYTCLNNKPKNAYPFAHGAADFPKREEDDEKTPVGTYTLGTPRNSYDGFHIFIPVGYPTAEQRAKGYTGGDIGIHGPEREKACFGLKSVAVNWTTGCVGLASDESIEAVAAFVRQNPGIKIHLLPKLKRPQELNISSKSAK